MSNKINLGKVRSYLIREDLQDILSFLDTYSDEQLEWLEKYISLFSRDTVPTEDDVNTNFEFFEAESEDEEKADQNFYELEDFSFKNQTSQPQRSKHAQKIDHAFKALSWFIGFKSPSEWYEFKRKASNYRFAKSYSASSDPKKLFRLKPQKNKGNQDISITDIIKKQYIQAKALKELHKHRYKIVSIALNINDDIISQDGTTLKKRKSKALLPNDTALLMCAIHERVHGLDSGDSKRMEFRKEVAKNLKLNTRSVTDKVKYSTVREIVFTDDLIYPVITKGDKRRAINQKKRLKDAIEYFKRHNLLKDQKAAEKYLSILEKGLENIASE